ncbi:MAG: hypothetical protein ACM30G_17485 [Micromonosporaceae bacterium]
MRARLVQQTENLQRKLRSLDRLGLSDVMFSEQFAGARIFIVGDAADGEAEGWAFANDVLRIGREFVGSEMVAQIDYDQRRLHPHLSGALDSIDFKTKHDPSALATSICFGTVLSRSGYSPEESEWLVMGAGELGRRIIGQAARATRLVHVVERLADRMEAVCRPGSVVPADPQLWPDLPIRAVVFAADSGSLTVEIARRLAANCRVAAVGGPEAGLDHNSAALAALTGAGTEFVPSVLCGSLGLVANLEEILGRTMDLPAAGRRLTEVVEAMLDRGRDLKMPFHEVCMGVLGGQIDV